MAKCVFRNGRIIKDYSSPYIVAELNSSHGGDLEKARSLIDAAKKAGADCVKFQSWNKESLYSKTYYDENRLAERFVRKFSLSPEKLKEMADYCREQGLDFSSTPYSKAEVDFLSDEAEAPFIKVASMEINNPSFLEYIGRKGVPVVLSTGMSDMDEIRRAVRILENAGAAEITILHCVSIYPTDLTSVNLNNIIGLREEFPTHPIGFSDHTRGNEASVAAVALGAGLLEKHLTLDRETVGMDNKMATEPDEFIGYVRACRDTVIAMGTKERVVSEAEREQRVKMRRSLVSARDLSAGHVIEAADLTAKRPGSGFSPDREEELIGKTLQRDIPADTVIFPEDIL